ncbi:hypothetical protein IG631_05561 [Alternaria alternata]|nr:hypothetical protein IG631_05561 [Alternaria alternata]
MGINVPGEFDNSDARDASKSKELRRKAGVMGPWTAFVCSLPAKKRGVALSTDTPGTMLIGPRVPLDERK